VRLPALRREDIAERPEPQRAEPEADDWLNQWRPPLPARALRRSRRRLRRARHGL